MARDRINLFINGEPLAIGGREAVMTLSDYVRRRRGMTGTKIVCSEGDCGACTVLAARLDEAGEPRYRPLDACITFMFQLDHTHVVTVEGLASCGGCDGAFHPVQRAMVDGHGSQCGFCTPGFVMAMAGLCEDARAAGEATLGAERMRYGLTGNLCRCTGYVQIIDAGRAVDPTNTTPLGERYPVGPMRAVIARDEAGGGVRVTGEGLDVCIASSVEQAAAYLAQAPGARVVCGATDVGVAVNKGRYTLDRVLYVGGVGPMRRIAYDDGELVIGAAATWSDVLAFVRDPLPQFAAVLDLFGAPQVRNAGTIGGNVVNASPIADSLPLLYVTDAKLALTSTAGSRTVAVADFYRGYKKLDLRPGELLTEVRLKLPTRRQRLLLYKVSKRRDLDISSFTAAINLTLDAGVIADAAIAYGGVGPVVLRLPKTEALMRGKPLSESLMHEAGPVARSEITPITDVRGSSDYRGELAETILLKAYHDLTGAGEAIAAGH